MTPLYEIEYRRWLICGRRMSVTLQCGRAQGEAIARLLLSRRHGVVLAQMDVAES